LPDHLLIPGREYWLTNLPYRGGRLSLGYRVEDVSEVGGITPGALTILIHANVPTRCRVLNPRTREEHVSVGAKGRHEIGGRNGEVYVVELRPGRSRSRQ